MADVLDSKVTLIEDYEEKIREIIGDLDIANRERKEAEDGETEALDLVETLQHELQTSSGSQTKSLSSGCADSEDCAPREEPQPEADINSDESKSLRAADQRTHGGTPAPLQVLPHERPNRHSQLQTPHKVTATVDSMMAIRCRELETELANCQQESDARAKALEDAELTHQAHAELERAAELVARTCSPAADVEVEVAMLRTQLESAEIERDNAVTALQELREDQTAAHEQLQHVAAAAQKELSALTLSHKAELSASHMAMVAAERRTDELESEMQMHESELSEVSSKVVLERKSNVEQQVELEKRLTMVQWHNGVLVAQPCPTSIHNGADLLNFGLSSGGIGSNPAGKRAEFIHRSDRRSSSWRR
eukprot:SAG31_NODE_3188_length_4574_cov_2.395978_3_plen_367_part_00